MIQQPKKKIGNPLSSSIGHCGVEHSIELKGENYGRISSNRICFWNDGSSSTSEVGKTYKNLRFL